MTINPERYPDCGTVFWTFRRPCRDISSQPHRLPSRISHSKRLPRQDLLRRPTQTATLAQLPHLAKLPSRQTLPKTTPCHPSFPIRKAVFLLAPGSATDILPWL